MTDTRFFISNYPWFTAYEVELVPNERYLKVRRALTVQEDNPMLAPIGQFLADHPHEVEDQTEVEDADIDSGKAVETRYRLR